MQRKDLEEKPDGMCERSSVVIKKGVETYLVQFGLNKLLRWVTVRWHRSVSIANMP